MLERRMYLCGVGFSFDFSLAEYIEVLMVDSSCHSSCNTCEPHPQHYAVPKLRFLHPRLRLHRKYAQTANTFGLQYSSIFSNITVQVTYFLMGIVKGHEHQLHVLYCVTSRLIPYTSSLRPSVAEFEFEIWRWRCPATNPLLPCLNRPRSVSSLFRRSHVTICRNL